MTQNFAPVLNAIVRASIEKPGQSNTETIDLFDKGTGLGFIFKILLEFRVTYLRFLRSKFKLIMSAIYITASVNIS